MSQKSNEVSKADVTTVGSAQASNADVWAGIAQTVYDKPSFKTQIQELLGQNPWDDQLEPAKKATRLDNADANKIDGEIEIRRPAAPPATGQVSFRGIPEGDNTSETTENGETLVNIKNPDGSVSQYPAKKTVIDGKTYYMVANENEPAGLSGLGKLQLPPDSKLPPGVPNNDHIRLMAAQTGYLSMVNPY